MTHGGTGKQGDLCSLLDSDLRDLWARLNVADGLQGSIKFYRITPCQSTLPTVDTLYNTYLTHIAPIESGLDERASLHVHLLLATIAKSITDTIYASQARPNLWDVDRHHRMLANMEQAVFVGVFLCSPFGTPTSIFVAD